MLMKIGAKEYNCSPSFATMVLYRADVGKSYFSEASAPERMIRLIYLSINEKERPYYHQFVTEATADAEFPASALHFMQECTRGSNLKNIEYEESLPEIDEYQIVAMWTQIGLPPFLMEKLNIAQVAELLKVAIDFKNGDFGPRIMSAAERKKIYGITPDKEIQIEKYLREKMEEQQ